MKSIKRQLIIMALLSSSNKDLYSAATVVSDIEIDPKAMAFQSSKLDESLKKLVQDGKGDEVKKIIAKTPDINATDERGMSALLWAISFGHTNIVRFLIDCKADVNFTGRPDKETPLLRANKVNILELLIAAKGDVNAANIKGYTSLMSRSLFGRIDHIKLLLQAGADLEKVDVEGKNALDYAHEEDEFLDCAIKLEIAKLLENEWTNRKEGQELRREIINRVSDVIPVAVLSDLVGSYLPSELIEYKDNIPEQLRFATKERLQVHLMPVLSTIIMEYLPIELPEYKHIKKSH